MFKVRINRAEYSIIPHLWFVNILGKFLLFVEQARHQSVDGDRLTVGGGGATSRLNWFHQRITSSQGERGQ